MTKRKIATLNQPAAARQSQGLQALGTAAHAGDQLLQALLALLFDDLTIDQIGMRFLHRFLGTAWLPVRGQGFRVW
jgi:hypothetical protein